MSVASSKKVRPSDLPPILLLKMQHYWTKVQKTFQHYNSKMSGQEFQKVCEGIGCDMTEKDMQKVYAVCGTREGEIDKDEFISVVEKLLFPPAYSDGLSLNFVPNFRLKRPEGRLKNFVNLSADWNNNYHQSLDVNGTGKPILQNIIQGKYYSERTDPYDRPESSLSSFKGMLGTQMDSTRSQPMVKSLIQGEFYENRPSSSLGKDKVDFIAHNKRMTKEYSKLVAGTRPHSSMSNRERKGSYVSDGTFQNITAKATHQVRTKLAQNLSTPRNAEELQELWGRTLDPKFVATTLAWLSKASNQEKKQFKQAVCAFPVQITARPAVGRSSITPSAVRPHTATGVRESYSSSIPSYDKVHATPKKEPFFGADAQDPSTAVSPTRSQKERPASRSGIDRGAIEAATAYAKAQRALRPSSAMSDTRPRTPLVMTRASPLLIPPSRQSQVRASKGGMSTRSFRKRLSKALGQLLL